MTNLEQILKTEAAAIPTLSSALGHGAADKRIEILRLVKATGSISEAARQARVSYKAAWQAIDTLSNLASTALVKRAVGGAGGGGARVTLAGDKLLEAAIKLNEARDSVLASLHFDGNVMPAEVRLLSGLRIKTSMRNQLPCTVEKMKIQGHQVTVDLALQGGAMVVSRITKASAELLGLTMHQQVVALCKATAVRVAPLTSATAPPNLAEGRQTLAGRTVRVSRSALCDEVSLELKGGLQLVGFADSGSGITKHTTVQAWLDASSLVIAIET